MIIVLVGLMGSGKSTIGVKLAEDLNYHFLEVSDIVKSILNEKNRSSMVRESLHRKDEDPMWLAEPLKVKLQEHNNWVVSGVREIALMDAIRDLGQQVQVIELKCTDRARLRRCKDKYKTLEDLRKADSVDKNLGIDEVLSTADMSLSTNSSLKKTREELVILVESFAQLD